jgi:hypothetical protein
MSRSGPHLLPSRNVIVLYSRLSHIGRQGTLAGESLVRNNTTEYSSTCSSIRSSTRSSTRSSRISSAVAVEEEEDDYFVPKNVPREYKYSRQYLKLTLVA